MGLVENPELYIRPGYANRMSRWKISSFDTKIPFSSFIAFNRLNFSTISFHYLSIILYLSVFLSLPVSFAILYDSFARQNVAPELLSSHIRFINALLPSLLLIYVLWVNCSPTPFSFEPVISSVWPWKIVP